MCGFVFACFKNKNDLDSKKNILESSSEKYIKSRGPTYQDSFFSQNIFCYQSVLSIQNHNQILKYNTSYNSSKFILYNGEIYSRKNATSEEEKLSDTEYLNKLNIEDNLNKEIFNLDGMFALCSVQVENEINYKVSFFRDVAGEKHLWYFINSDIFILSSVPAVIVDYIKCFSSLEINHTVLEDYLLRRHLISPKEHVIDGIKQILPGTYNYFSSNDWIVKEVYRKDILDYFDPKEYKYLSKQSEKYVDELTNYEIEKVIKSMTRVCSKDIKQSSILSGGIDSSLVTAFVQKNYYKEMDIYTLLVEEKDNVSPHAIEMSNKINTNDDLSHKQINCKPEEYFKALLHSISILSSPINTHSIPSSYLVAKKASEDGNEVLYGGEGADELFLGYGCYLKNDLSDYNRIVDNFKYLEKLYDSVSSSFINRYLIKQKNNFYSSPKLKFLSKKEKHLLSESYLDYIIQLPNVGLISTDTVNSDLGIECRTPFTRIPLLKLGLSIPLDKKINEKSKNKTKLPLKNLFLKIYGNENIYPKIGFAGFPNESKVLLPSIDKWNIWDLLGIKKINENKLNRDEYWKLLNIELFYRVVIKNENLLP